MKQAPVVFHSLKIPKAQKPLLKTDLFGKIGNLPVMPNITVPIGARIVWLGVKEENCQSCSQSQKKNKKGKVDGRGGVKGFPFPLILGQFIPFLMTKDILLDLLRHGNKEGQGI